MNKSTRIFIYLTFFIAVFSSPLISWGQDPLFTQFYASPLYLNPALTGEVSDYRVATTYRDQWTGIPGSFQTNIVSFDYNLSKMNSGVGIYFLNDRTNALDLKTNQIAASYSYKIPLSKKVTARAGLQAGYIFKNSDVSRLTFGDQIENGGGNTLENINNFNAALIDFSTGFVVYSEKYWIGASMFHINQPRKSTPEGEISIDSRFSIQGGARFPLDLYDRQKTSISPAFIYQHQGLFSQLDLGFNYFYKPVMAGIWYRGNPFKGDVNNQVSQDAIAFLAGYQYKSFWFGYSYDISISGLSGRSGGTHEISIVLEPVTLTGRDRVKCPAFYKVY